MLIIAKYPCLSRRMISAAQRSSPYREGLLLISLFPLLTYTPARHDDDILHASPSPRNSTLSPPASNFSMLLRYPAAPRRRFQAIAVATRRAVFRLPLLFRSIRCPSKASSASFPIYVNAIDDAGHTKMAIQHHGAIAIAAISSLSCRPKSIDCRLTVSKRLHRFRQARRQLSTALPLSVARGRIGSPMALLVVIFAARCRAAAWASFFKTLP